MYQMRLQRRFACLALVAGLLCATAHAQLAPPKGPVVLTVSGNITQTNQGKNAVFDMAMLEALQQRTTRTATPWHAGVVEFKGPLGRALMAAVGAKGEQLTIVAHNDYKSKMPVDDLNKHDVIFATRQNGELMTLRNKGPLFVIYPFDEVPALKSEVYFNRSVWQIKSIQVE